MYELMRIGDHRNTLVKYNLKTNHNFKDTKMFICIINNTEMFKSN